MFIKWYGQSCFQLTVSQGKGEKVNIVIDPFDKEIGLKPPSLKADIVLITHQHPDHNNLESVHPVKSAEGGASPLAKQFNRVKNNPFVIDSAGEYEIKGIFIEGIPAFHDEKQGKERGEITCWTIEAEEMRICHLGALGQKELTNEQLEHLGEVDILMVPVGGFSTIDGAAAQEIINQIEPRIILPMHYRIVGISAKLEPVDNFLKAMGQKAIEPLQKLVLKKKDLPEEETKIILLTP